MWDYSVFWDEAMNQAKAELGEHEFGLWFNIKYARSLESTILVHVPSSFYRDNFQRKYQEYLESKLFDLSGMAISLEFEIVKPEMPARPRSASITHKQIRTEIPRAVDAAASTDAGERQEGSVETARTSAGKENATYPAESGMTGPDTTSADAAGTPATPESEGKNFGVPEHVRILRRLSESLRAEEDSGASGEDGRGSARDTAPPTRKPVAESTETRHEGFQVSPGLLPSGWPMGAKDRHPQLRPDCVFENFVVGENNKFAANAALAICANPGYSYNPLLIYGGVGLGKTHLMQSIGNRIWQSNPKVKILCITAEEFTNELVLSLHDKATHTFKNKYRSVDVLLIDDIHFFQGKQAIQEEVFHTFNSLYDTNRQMVFTCDRPVSELKNLSDRLRSRFERGLNVDLQPPDFETRCAILMRKVNNLGISVPNDVIAVVAKNISTNVRDLEAALTKLVAYADLVHKSITLEIAQSQLKDVFSQSRQGNVTIDAIIRTVADHFNLSLADMKGKKRTKNVVFPRQLAMFIVREMTEYSTTEIGMEFGGRDHTTVMHGCQKIEERLKLDPAMDSMLQSLIRSVKDLSSR